MFKKLVFGFLLLGFILSGLSSTNAEYLNGVTNWTIPMGNDWNVNLDNYGSLIVYQQLFDAQTGQLICEHTGTHNNAIDRTHLYHSLIYEAQIVGTPNNNRILIPCYVGGDISIYTDWDSCVRHNSYSSITINNWINYNIGDGQNGVGTYSLPPDAVL
jgi:hypothetical protein